jgi:hypothetical protein
MIGFSVTEAVMVDEMPAITAWAQRNGWIVTFDKTALKGRAEVQHPKMNRTIVFWFDVEGYPDRQPPAWWCGGDGESVSKAPADYPHPPLTATPAGSPVGSIFHMNQVICAPWNRLAYGLHGGPHGDWASLAAWRTNAPGNTQANEIVDMLSQLALHLSFSDGMQG